MLFAEGDNYRIEIENGRACCTVRRRPDLDSAEGARSAEEQIAHFGTLSARDDVWSMIFDLRTAPPFSGPRTQRALATAFSSFERAAKPLAVVCGAAVQAMQLQRILAINTPLYGRDFPDFEQACSWVESYRQSKG